MPLATLVSAATTALSSPGGGRVTMESRVDVRASSRAGGETAGDECNLEEEESAARWPERAVESSAR